jgi:uncharacterized protein YcbX
MRVAALYRYPVKGLSPQPLSSAHLKAGGYFPGDRLLAFENGPSGFDPKAPKHQPKIKFLMLMRNARLAALTTAYDDDSRVLSIAQGGRELMRKHVGKPQDRADLEAFFTDYLKDEIRGPVRLLAAPEGFRFTDSKSGFVSLVNLASVAAIGASMGATLDPLRFRANIYVEGIEAWGETELVGKTIGVGATRLEILKMTDRCAATGVSPGVGERDMDVVQAIRMGFGHIDCGVYARVVEGGRIFLGDAMA